MKKSELKQLIIEVLNEHDITQSEYNTITRLTNKVISTGHYINKYINEYDENDNPKLLDDSIEVIKSVRPILDKLEKIFLNIKKEHKK